jgi:site-specific DNA recombinase
MPSKRAAIYARISQDRGGAGLGIDRQEQDCRQLAERLGWSVTAVHSDNDVSAYSGKPRSGYRALLEEIEAGRINAVLCWHNDRLHRSPRELEDYIDLCQRHRVTTQTVTAGEFDLATPTGKAVARTVGAWATQESEHKAERVRRAGLQKAKAGGWLGGTRPFGWQLVDGVPKLDEAEAGEVREVAERLLAGRSLGSLVTDLNRRGVTTSTGRAWNYTSLRQVLTRPRNAGMLTYGGAVVDESTWPPILERQTWHDVCAVLNDPRRRRSTSNRLKWMLAGLAICGPCGGTLRSGGMAMRDGTSATCYRCRQHGEGHVSRLAEPLDDYVGRLVVARLSRADAVHLLARPGARADGDGADPVRDLAAMRERRRELNAMFLAGEITRAERAQMTEHLDERMAAAELLLDAAERPAVLAEFGQGRDAVDVWAELPIARRRAVVDLLMTVTVNKPTLRGVKGFDADAVDIEWKTA